MYALIRDGVVIDTADRIPEGSLQEPRGAKPYWLPRVDVMPDEHDDDTEVLDESIEIAGGQVTRTYTARARTADEWASLRAPVLARLEAEFRRRWQSPIDYLGATWHADQEAVNNISGVVLLIAAGVPVPNPRPWTPRGSFTPVEVTHAELVGLGAAIASRKDALFAAKKAKQAEVAGLTSVAALAAYDVAVGWE